MFEFLKKSKATLTLSAESAVKNQSFPAQEFILKEEKIEIGKNKSPFSEKFISKIGSKITIASNDLTKKISINHSLLTWDMNTSTYTYQEQSEKGSLVNGEPLEKGEETVLEDGSEILIHPFKFTLKYTPK